jgi:hypothetical protein
MWIIDEEAEGGDETYLNLSVFESITRRHNGVWLRRGGSAHVGRTSHMGETNARRIPPGPFADKVWAAAQKLSVTPSINALEERVVGLGAAVTHLKSLHQVLGGCDER